LTTWGNSSAIPTDNANQGDQLAHDGPVLGVDEELDPAGAVTARTVEAGPSLVGEGTPEDSDVGSRPRDEVSIKKVLC
jgi:DNA repair protein RAD7